jgi:hypothetical protein
MSLFSSFWQFLSGAPLPRVAAGFTDNSVVVLELKKKGGDYIVEHQASAVLPKAILQPDFSASNIPEPASLASLLRQACDRAGLKRHSRWSIALPEGVARTMIVNFENRPNSREELEEMIQWKVERVIGTEPGRLRLVRQQISTEGLPRYLITAVEESVIAEYESVFRLLGWHAGLILPRHMGETLWLARDSEAGDKLLVSHSYWGFVAVALRGSEPLMVRIHNCGIEERENDLFRLATYYREKVADTTAGPFRVLTIGDRHEVELTERTFNDAFGDLKYLMLNPAQLPIRFPDAGIGFDQLAATAGLASLAFE